jgi:hypothetical protein
MMQRFPWGEVMRLGIATYHIPLTRGDDGLKRGQLIELMKLWPD